MESSGGVPSSNPFDNVLDSNDSTSSTATPPPPPASTAGLACANPFDAASPEGGGSVNAWNPFDEIESDKPPAAPASSSEPPISENGELTLEDLSTPNPAPSGLTNPEIANDERFKKLVTMGFAELTVEAALRKYKDLHRAADWCLQNGSGAGTPGKSRFGLASPRSFRKTTLADSPNVTKDRPSSDDVSWHRSSSLESSDTEWARISTGSATTDTSVHKGQSASVDLTGLDMSALDQMFTSPGGAVAERERSKSVEQHLYPDMSDLQDYDTSASAGAKGDLVDMDFGGTSTPTRDSEGVGRYSSSARKRLAPEQLRRMKSGETKFNINPKDGLAFLQRVSGMYCACFVCWRPLVRCLVSTYNVFALSTGISGRRE
jgi:hypothetical protein